MILIGIAPFGAAFGLAHTNPNESNLLSDNRFLETVRYQQMFQPNTRDGRKQTPSRLTNV